MTMTMTTMATTMSDSNSNSNAPKPGCWIDTDVGFDDLVAIRCLDTEPTTAINGISTVGTGIVSYPFDGAAILEGLLLQQQQQLQLPMGGSDSGSESERESESEQDERESESESEQDERESEQDETETKKENSHETCKALNCARTPVPIVLAGRKRRFRSSARGEAAPGSETRNHPNDDDDDDDDNNDEPESDPSWLGACREQMRSFCFAEGIGGRLSDRTVGTPNDRATAALVADAIAAAAGANTTNNNNKKKNDTKKKKNDATTLNDDKPIDLVCLGPLTNLATWLDERPDLASPSSSSSSSPSSSFTLNQFGSIWILGGNIPVPESASSVVPPEFNFARDPEAVRRVLAHEGFVRSNSGSNSDSGTTIVHVVPQEVCDRCAFEESFPARQSQSGINDYDSSDSFSGERPLVRSAVSIVAEWLESPVTERMLLPEQQPATNGAAKRSSATPLSSTSSSSSAETLSSLLPPWIERLIQTRTYSVYGDPICIYVRDNYYNNASSNGTVNTHDECGTATKHSSAATATAATTTTAAAAAASTRPRRPRIRWKDYYYSTCSESFDPDRPRIGVDPHGKLVLRETAAAPLAASAATSTGSNNDNNNNNNNNKTNTSIIVRIAHEVELGPIYLDWLAKALRSD